ncbi:MAG: alkaline phosphatase family protein, partial [Mycobacteriales bacterium]
YSDPAQHIGQFSWRTMPENLQEAGVSWKWYTTPDGQLDDVLPFFKAYNDPSSPLFANAFGSQYPATLAADVAAGTLPSVSWILPSVTQSEHPAAPPEYGEYAVSQVLSILTSNPSVWERTALFLTYDENGGFFDHVPPPVAPPGTPGEYVTAHPLPSDASGIAGPIGLGFRVPMLVISPFSRGGYVCSEVFDHTSMLRFLETRFGVAVPNLTPWRRGAVGDLTGAFSFGLPPQPAVPSLPATSLAAPDVVEECIPAGVTGTEDQAPAYPVPATNTVPTQEPGSAPAPVTACSRSAVAPPPVAPPPVAPAPAPAPGQAHGAPATLA